MEPPQLKKQSKQASSNQKLRFKTSKREREKASMKRFDFPDKHLSSIESDSRPIYILEKRAQ